MATATTNYTLKCIAHGHINSAKETTTYCTQCGSVLRIYYEEASDRLKYPLKTLVPDPLKTQTTALKQLDRLSDTYNADLCAKLDFQHPTVCTKDRGTYIGVLQARELKAVAICLASTGTMAASVAAYACYFHIPCFVSVPEKTTEPKLAQATIFDANIIR